MSLVADYVHNRDLDRIHGVLSNIDEAKRREGKTFATLMLMLGEAQLADEGNHYLYVGENWNWTRSVQRDFFEILEVEGLDVERVVQRPSELRCQGKMFRFAAINHNIDRDVCRGALFDRTFIDLTYETERLYHEEIHLIKCREIKT